MPQLTQQQYLAALRAGTANERVTLVRDLPPNGFKDQAIALIATDNPGMSIVALGILIQQYCYGSNPDIGAPLAAAAHDRALEIWETVPNHGLIPTTLSGLANSHVKALALLGRSSEVLEATARYVPLYEQLGENQNLPSLKVLRIEALVNLKRFDDAFGELQDHSIFDNPITRIEADRLKGVVDRHRADVTQLPSEHARIPGGPSAAGMLEAMKQAIDLGVQGEAGEALKARLGALDGGKPLTVSDPTRYGQLLDLLNESEKLFTRGGSESELTVRQTVRNASAIFVHGKPEPDAIRASLAKLESARQWAGGHGITDLENDALWGIYLCRNRLNLPSEAADALIDLRQKLESIRGGIGDPLKRGGIFSNYRYLFNALCEQLYKANRTEDLLEAIESSKGRAIADRITAQSGDVVADSAMYVSAERLMDLARRERFHYLSYFVDEERVYATLVSKQGSVHAIEPVQISDRHLREAAEAVAPESWGRPQPWDPSARIADTSVRLAPLVAWLDELIAKGVVERNDHICYSSDDQFHNVPLQYLRFRDGILLNWFSVSRVHSAFHVARVLSAEAQRAPKQYVGFVVPATEDLAKGAGDKMLDDLDAPLRSLKALGRIGQAVRLKEATLERVEREGLDQRIVHFSTHGWFPKRGNPYRDSYLLLAGTNGLPSGESAAQGAQDGRLTPDWILQSELDLEGSHVSMMACVSGLAKEGIGGDTLGLDWAFIQAGASSLVSAHWEISAASAARFFHRFYEKWIDGKKSRASAHREAVIELLEDEPTPNSLQQWAGFSLTGDFR